MDWIRPCTKTLSLFFVISLLSSWRIAPAAQQCVKEVFNAYCLGGAVSDLLAQRIPKEDQQRDDGRQLTFEDGGKTVVVKLRDDRILSVARQEKPGSWINFLEWRRKLNRIYGSGEDLSEFPRSATSRSSRLNAINAGKGFAKMIWPQKGWSASLAWATSEYVLLEYELEASGDSGSLNNEGL